MFCASGKFVTIEDQMLTPVQATLAVVQTAVGGNVAGRYGR